MQANWLGAIGQFTKRNSPTILSAIAAAGVVTTAILAVKATPKALRKLEAAEPSEVVLNRQRVALVWTDYLPAGIAGAATIACIIGANRAGMRQTAAMAAAYTLVNSTFNEYKDHVLAEIGEAKELKVREKIMEDRIQNSPPNEKTVLVTGRGDQLCFDSVSGQYFRSDVELIRRAENEANAQMLTGDMWLSLNEWYDFIGVEHAAIGDELGWNIENRIELSFSSHLAPDGTPCLAIAYKKLPFSGYGKCF